MLKSILSFLIFFLIISMFYSCKKNSRFTSTPLVPDQSFAEEFDAAASATTKGWQFINTSDPKGSGVWEDGGSIPPFFNAYSNKGSLAGFIGADYTSTSAQQGVISNWLISPSIIMQNGDKIIFYTRAYTDFYGGDTTDFGNSLQVSMNAINDNVSVGQGANAGSFTKVLLNINPDLAWSSVINPVVAYPTQWTRFVATVDGLSKPLRSRFAFRYFVTDGGSNGNGSGIGIDSVAYISSGY